MTSSMRLISPGEQLSRLIISVPTCRVAIIQSSVNIKTNCWLIKRQWNRITIITPVDGLLPLGSHIYPIMVQTEGVKRKQDFEDCIDLFFVKTRALSEARNPITALKNFPK